MNRGQWFLLVLGAWALIWAVLEKLAYERRRKRDKYIDLNEGR